MKITKEQWDGLLCRVAALEGNNTIPASKLAEHPDFIYDGFKIYVKDCYKKSAYATYKGAESLFIINKQLSEDHLSRIERFIAALLGTKFLAAYNCKIPDSSFDWVLVASTGEFTEKQASALKFFIEVVLDNFNIRIFQIK